jgi:hypothetical protein
MRGARVAFEQGCVNDEIEFDEIEFPLGVHGATARAAG